MPDMLGENNNKVFVRLSNGIVLEISDQDIVYKNIPGRSKGRRARPEHDDIIEWSDTLRVTPDIEAPHRAAKVNEFIKRMHMPKPS